MMSCLFPLWTAQNILFYFCLFVVLIVIKKLNGSEVKAEIGAPSSGKNCAPHHNNNSFCLVEDGNFDISDIF